jgi:hypothetical protein
MPLAGTRFQARAKYWPHQGRRIHDFACGAVPHDRELPFQTARCAFEREAILVSTGARSRKHFIDSWTFFAPGNRCSEAICHSGGASPANRAAWIAVLADAATGGDRSIESLDVKAPLAWENPV